MAKKNIEAAERTYSTFTGMVKWATPVVAVIVLIVVLLIAP